MANRSYHEQIAAIKADARKAYDSIVRDIAREAANDLAKTAYSIISDFYESYEPKYYNRTKNLYNMVVKHTSYKYGIDNAYISSITTASVMMHDNYKISPNVIYDLMWNKGHRGLPFQELEPKWYPKTNVDGYLLASISPDLLMHNYIKHWGKLVGSKKIEKIGNKYKSNNYITFY